MVYEKKFVDRYNEYKDVILETFVECYGERYRELIIKRLNNTYFDFSSNPIDVYKFAQKDKKKFGVGEYVIAKTNYLEYNATVEKLRKHKDKALFELVKKVFHNDDVDEDVFKNFINCFMDEDVEVACIDSYVKEYDSILDDEDVPDCIKENLIFERSRFRNAIKALGINVENLTEEIIQEFIECRKKLFLEYRIGVAKESKYGRKIKKELEDWCGKKITGEVVEFFVFKNNACAGRFNLINDPKNEEHYLHFVKMPIIRLLNNRVRSFDVTLIHELIHRIEQGIGATGINVHDEKSTNEIVNEIRTQMLAEKVTKRLREKGVCIFDNPNDWTIVGETVYEDLYPLAEYFIRHHEKFFLECAIENDYKRLEEYFGSKWVEYSKELGFIFCNLSFYLSKNGTFYDLEIDDEIEKMITAMNEHYERKVKPECIKV